MILTNVCFSTAPIDFFAFSHGFSTQKFDFHSETTRTPFGLPTRNLYECRADFSKIHLLCFFKSGKNNKLGSVKNSRGIIRTLQADFSKGFGIRFFKDVSAELQRCSQSDKTTDPELKEKDGKTLAHFLNRNRTNKTLAHFLNRNRTNKQHTAQ
jgi:hypothetical protein